MLSWQASAGGVILASNTSISGYGFLFLFLSSGQLLMASVRDRDRDRDSVFSLVIYFCRLLRNFSLDIEIILIELAKGCLLE
jgi:hypothetical protein